MSQTIRRWKTRLNQIELIKNCVDQQQNKISLLTKNHYFALLSNEKLESLKNEMMKIAEESISSKIIDYEQGLDDAMTTLEALINIVHDKTSWPWSSSIVINSLFEFLKQAIDYDTMNKEIKYKIMFYKDIKLKLLNLEQTFKPLSILLTSYILQCSISLGESLVHKRGYQQIKDAIDLKKHLKIDMLDSVVNRWIGNQITLLKAYDVNSIMNFLKISLESQLEDLLLNQKEHLKRAKSCIEYSNPH